MSEGIKPCPFCGEYSQVIVDYVDDLIAFKVICTKCFASSRSVIMESPAKSLTNPLILKGQAINKAIEAWNRRAEQ